jgi:hypothetical protein
MTSTGHRTSGTAAGAGTGGVLMSDGSASDESDGPCPGTPGPLPSSDVAIPSASAVVVVASPPSAPIVERWFRRAVGERASREMSWVEGKSGTALLTSVSIRWRNSLNVRQAAPIWRATWGSLSGPRRMTATTAIMRSFAGSRLSTGLTIKVPCKVLNASNGTPRTPSRQSASSFRDDWETECVLSAPKLNSV